MRIAADINCFYGIYTIEETIDILTDAGFEAIDFTFMDGRYYNGDISEAECRAHYAEVKKYAENKGVCFNQSHAPCPSSTLVSRISPFFFLFTPVVSHFRQTVNSYFSAKKNYARSTPA